VNRRAFFRRAAASSAAATLLYPAAAQTAEPQPIALPKPQRLGGKPLMQALNERKSTKEMGEAKLSTQQLSNLLWAAFGVNRDDGRRTAPTAMNVQDIRIYVFLEEGVYLYDAAGHALAPVASGDRRAAAGGPPAVAKAAVALVYVSDNAKYRSAGRGGAPDPALVTAWSNVHAGFIGQNVYLYAASEGLGALFRAGIDTVGLSKLLGLGPAEKPLYAQNVGAPVGAL
jgi:nitroreductase